MSDTQLWSDELIQERYQAAFEKRPDVHQFALLTWMRDEYEARIAELEAQLANQYQRIERFVELVDQLEAQLAAATLEGRINNLTGEKP